MVNNKALKKQCRKKLAFSLLHKNAYTIRYILLSKGATSFPEFSPPGERA